MVRARGGGLLDLRAAAADSGRVSPLHAMPAEHAAPPFNERRTLASFGLEYIQHTGLPLAHLQRDALPFLTEPLGR
jgi:hypothetical protein